MMLDPKGTRVSLTGVDGKVNAVEREDSNSNGARSGIRRIPDEVGHYLLGKAQGHESQCCDDGPNNDDRPPPAPF